LVESQRLQRISEGLSADADAVHQGRLLLESDARLRLGMGGADLGANVRQGFTLMADKLQMLNGLSFQNLQDLSALTFEGLRALSRLTITVQ